MLVSGIPLQAGSWGGRCVRDYRGTLLIRNSAPLGAYSMSMPRALWWS